MEEKILNYLINEKGCREIVAEEITQSICKYADIESDFLKWLDTRSYDYPNPLIVEGYTAADIYKMAPFMDGVGVYIFMADLRDAPEFAKESIANGFPRK